MIVNPGINDSYPPPAQSPQKRQVAVKNQVDKAILESQALSKKAAAQKGNVANRSKFVDRVDLSTKLSIDDVNRLLEREVGKKVKQMFEKAGIDPSAIAETDWSPRATADRIFRGTTSLFEIWKAQHKNMSPEELIDSFEHVLRASVHQGANEAIGLIEAHKFEDEQSIVSTAKETISLVNERFDAYFEDLRSKLSERAGERESEPQTKGETASEDRS
ncbi:MAG: DUF5610 domain-containing protein [Deltaproteobacteria bacterium]|nr:DUF5610 domain-containing protein [Deltaproteobacteria bacterium]